MDTRRVWTWWGAVLFITAAGAGMWLAGQSGEGSRYVLTLGAAGVAVAVGLGHLLWSRGQLGDALGGRLLGLAGLVMSGLLLADLPNHHGTAARLLVGLFALALILPLVAMLMASKDATEPSAGEHPRPVAAWVRMAYALLSGIALFAFIGQVIDGEGPLGFVFVIASWGFLDRFRRTVRKA